ncbi:hypothetical protein BaRGS_00014073 [Batillaria attramentaria]|uniref:Uncharacterized protein n=1 Tax=Batillaria attramentaria TaxID=370345 RepID=A0ABD0L5J3_9CAEN
MDRDKLGVSADQVPRCSDGVGQPYGPGTRLVGGYGWVEGAWCDVLLATSGAGWRVLGVIVVPSAYSVSRSPHPSHSRTPLPVQHPHPIDNRHSACRGGKLQRNPAVTARSVRV